MPAYATKKRSGKKFSKGKIPKMIDPANYKRKFIKETKMWLHDSQNGSHEGTA